MLYRGRKFAGGRIFFLCRNGAGQKQGGFGTGWSDDFIQKAGGKNNSRKQRSCFTGEQALAQSRQTDGDSGLGNQGQAKKIPGFSLCFGNEATRISPKIFSSDPDQEIGDAGRTGC